MALISSVIATSENSIIVTVQGESGRNYHVRVHRKGDPSNVFCGSERVSIKSDMDYVEVDFTFNTVNFNTTVDQIDSVILYEVDSDKILDIVYPSLSFVTAPSIPTNISYPVSINSYNAVSISWSSVSGATSYVLERALHGTSSFIQVYSGSGTSYSDRIPSGATKAQYRVKAVNSGGSSGYKTGNISSVYYTKPNVAPTTPSSISVPSTVYGGKAFTVSWGASTDIDGNLSGYKLEQSYNSGSTWTQVYQGSATSTSITIPFGAATRVLYRVKAYDSDGAESGYKVSSTSTVVNNNAPTIPPSITVPLTINGGKSTTITWTASTDSDGNLSGYLLERSVNGGSYTQIYKGANKSYSNNITKGRKFFSYCV